MARTLSSLTGLRLLLWELPPLKFLGYYQIENEHWSELPFPSPGIFPTQGSNLRLLHCRQSINAQDKEIEAETDSKQEELTQCLLLCQM